MYYIYFLQLNNGEIYTGSTNNLEDRVKRHNKKEVFYTSNKLPAKLTSYIAVPNKYTAFNLEKYFKSGSGRAFIKKHKLLER
jgi:predicted GIY-YIG superfamily endonuclease